MSTVEQQVQRIPYGEWFKPKHKVLRKISSQAKTKSTTHPAVMKEDKELLLFTFPENVINNNIFLKSFSIII